MIGRKGKLRIAGIELDAEWIDDTPLSPSPLEEKKEGPENEEYRGRNEEGATDIPDSHAQSCAGAGRPTEKAWKSIHARVYHAVRGSVWSEGAIRDITAGILSDLILVAGEEGDHEAAIFLASVRLEGKR